jgi:SAM-dependent methyltransferase
VLTADLIERWQLEEPWIGWFNRREGQLCMSCMSSPRVQQMASAIQSALSQNFGRSFKSFDDLTRQPVFQRLRIAEINSVGTLHRFLARCPQLQYSEYGSSDPNVLNQDILNLSYADECFDMVLTSETLEHVPDFARGLREIRRTLRPDGLHIFTVPVIWDRSTTRRRAEVVDGETRHLLPPCYHAGGGKNAKDYLVFSEFGADITGMIESAGFQCEVRTDSENRTLNTFVTRKI